MCVFAAAPELSSQEIKRSLFFMNLLMNYAMTAMSGSNLLSSVASFFASHKLLANLLILLDYTSFLQSGVSALKVVIIAVGGGLAILGVVNLLEGYGNDNPGAKSQGMKHLMSSM